MKLPLFVTAAAEVYDDDGKLIADFHTVDMPLKEAFANATAYCVMMNAKAPVKFEALP